MILFIFLLPPDLRDLPPDLRDLTDLSERLVRPLALVVPGVIPGVIRGVIPGVIRGVIPGVIRGVIGGVIRCINRGAISDIWAGVTWGWYLLTCLLKLNRSENVVPLLHTKHLKMVVFVRFAAAEKIYTSAGKWKIRRRSRNPNFLP